MVLTRAKSSFSSSFGKAKNMFARKAPEAPPGQQEKKQFTESEKIKVAALYNNQQIKKRKSFIVEADVILQEGELHGGVAQNDPSAKIGCILKPQQSLRDVMAPEAHGVQTWHKKSNFSQSTPSLSRSRSGPVNSSYSAPSQRGVRNAFALEQALEALEEVEEEMKDLKQVIEDADHYEDNPQLQKAMTRLASQKKATLQDKLNFIVFEGEDCHVFDQLKQKLHKALGGMSVDWTSGGLDLTADELRLSGAQTPARTIGRAQSSRAPSVAGSQRQLFGGSEPPAISRQPSRASSVAR